MSIKSPPRDDNFVQEYLYIEEYYEYQIKTEEKDEEKDVEHGIIVIDLM